MSQRVYEMPEERPFESLNVKLFADGANKADLFELSEKPFIKGFTTNPSLMRKAGVTDYERFAREILERVSDRPISFEVFSDDFATMFVQARRIGSWGDNVYVKIPVTNTKGEPAYPLISQLCETGIKVNVTALMTLQQVEEAARALNGGPPACISVFAGRIADTGRDPVPIMRQAVQMLAAMPNIELIWASPRELLNVYQADALGCHIITATKDILAKVALIGKDLTAYSLETVQMFHSDALASGFALIADTIEESACCPS